MSKHTPGPWRVEEWDGVPLRITTDSVIVARVEWDQPIADEDEANARLIAAAPDLLEAAQNLSAISDGIIVNLTEAEASVLREAWVCLTAAITKATKP